MTQRSMIDAIAARYPTQRGTIRDHVTKQRSPFLRLFACGIRADHLRVDETASSARDPSRSPRQPPAKLIRHERPGLGDQRACGIHLSPNVPQQHTAHPSRL